MPASRSFSSRTPNRNPRGNARDTGRPAGRGTAPAGGRDNARPAGRTGDRPWGRGTNPTGDRGDRRSSWTTDRPANRSSRPDDRRDDRRYDRGSDRGYDRGASRSDDRGGDRNYGRTEGRDYGRSDDRAPRRTFDRDDRPAARRGSFDDRRTDDRRTDAPDKSRWKSADRATRRPSTDRDRDSYRPASAPAAPAADLPTVELPTAVVAPNDLEQTTFADLGLGRDLVAAINALGAQTPFPIQAATIPAALAGGDVLGRGRTGSGKTLAFGAPLIGRLAATATPGKKSYGRKPRALILAPTRELAMQISRTVTPLARTARLFTTVVVGGVPQFKQTQALTRGTDIVIGTPGRLEDLIEQGRLDLSEVTITVVDEADHMCDLGFLEPVQRLLRQTVEGGQRLLFSATLDRAVGTLVAEFLPDPSVHEVAGEDQASATIDHRLLQIEHRDKIDIITDMVDPKGRTLVFARTRLYAETLAEALNERGLSTASLHGDLTQAKRTRNLKLLDEGRVQVLVATDVAARGIHVDNIDLVVQADPPEDPKTYMHRAGRTGRAGRAGTVVTLTTRQRRYKTERLLRDAEITAVSAVARPGDRILGELGRHAG